MVTSDKNYNQCESSGQPENSLYPSIVLVHPEIPQNTGNIGRLTAALRTDLHLVEPLGFELSNRYLKRAGLDYWPEVKLRIHASWEALLEKRENNGRLFFLSTKGDRSYTSIEYQPSDYLVFGSETAGLPNLYHEKYSGDFVTIPMNNDAVRSLNLANAVAITLFEAKRQLDKEE